MRFGLYIDGEWRDSADGGTFDAINPATGKTVATVAAATALDVQLAVDAASRAQKEWQSMPARDRASLIRRLAEIMIRETDGLAELETLDAGGTLASSIWTVVDIAARRLEYFAGMTDKLEGSQIPVDDMRHVYTVREPLGVTAHIIPWNGPLWEASRSIAPALAAGNSVILKPASDALLGAIRLGELAAEAGLPPGLINVLPGSGETVGGSLVDHPHVRGIAFTGSVETGIALAQRAAIGMKRVVLELGGKASNIIFSDADLDRAIPGSVEAAFSNAGQICVAGARLLVHEDVRAEVTERLVESVSTFRLGPGMTDPDMGPVVSERHMSNVLSEIEAARSEGARLLCGGRRSDHGALAAGYFIEPTVLDDVHQDMRIAQEEVFGPVLTIESFNTEDEAVALANGTRYGLASGMWTRDLGRAHRVAARLESGQVYVNEWFCGGIQCPAGGYKMSGIGREEGIQALDNYLQLKSVRMNLG